MIRNSVIVGLDDSAVARGALRWAAQYAAATRADLCAVHVLEWPIGLKPAAVKSGTRLYVPQHDVSEAYWRGMHRVFDLVDTPTGSTLQFAQGDIVDVLVRLSAHADLLVVGSLGGAHRRPTLRGSISHYCVSEASCPVVTVPPRLADVRAEPFDHDTHRAHAHPVMS